MKRDERRTFTCSVEFKVTWDVYDYGRVHVCKFLHKTAMKVRHEVCVWFGVKELILSLKLILDTFSYVWFHVREEFRIISELKQL